MGGEAHSIGDHASMLPKNVIASQVNDVLLQDHCSEEEWLSPRTPPA